MAPACEPVYKADALRRGENAVRARNFLLQWVSKNIHADAFPGGRTEAHRLTKLLLAAAAARGITKADLEAAAEERLPSFLYVAMDDAALLKERLAPQAG
jgi:hypothetical protein